MRVPACSRPVGKTSPNAPTRQRSLRPARAARHAMPTRTLRGRVASTRPDRPHPPTLLAQRMIEFGHSTHVGLRREHNEDTYYADANLGLWLVADGMGGHEHGEVASALARDTLVREVGKGAQLIPAIQLADEEIIRHSTRRSEALPMGTTIAARTAPLR